LELWQCGGGDSGDFQNKTSRKNVNGLDASTTPKKQKTETVMVMQLLHKT
jgi:hypothetical protein